RPRPCSSTIPSSALPSSRGPRPPLVVPLRLRRRRLLRPRRNNSELANGAALRRLLRLLVPCVEARLLSEGNSFEEVSRILRHAAEQCGSQLHVPPSRRSWRFRRMAERHTGRLRLRLQSAHDAHSRHENEGGGKLHRRLPEVARTLARRTPPGPCPLSAAARFQVRYGAPRRLSPPA